MSVLMKCGHTAQGVDRATGKPVCVICVGIDLGAREVDNNASEETLKNRVARCPSCGHTLPSSYDLPFFEFCGVPRGSRSARGEDSFYCGCKGWD
jgi:endogenous inhibitor of DNA gyrase (YacG/DUF329 family)